HRYLPSFPPRRSSDLARFSADDKSTWPVPHPSRVRRQHLVASDAAARGMHARAAASRKPDMEKSAARSTAPLESEWSSADREWEDRKSTRLNSSHRTI